MANYQDLKQQIVTDMNRDDLEDDLTAALDRHISSACRYFAAERFWFNAIVVTASTVAGNPLVAMPASVRTVERITIPASYIELLPLSMEQIDDSLGEGTPRYFTAYGDNIRLTPTPMGVFTLNVYGIAAIAAPTADSDESAWTNEAADLIAARTRMTLYRDVFRDLEGMASARNAMDEELLILKRETGVRMKAPLRTEVALMTGRCW